MFVITLCSDIHITGICHRPNYSTEHWERPSLQQPKLSVCPRKKKIYIIQVGQCLQCYDSHFMQLQRWKGLVLSRSKFSRLFWVWWHMPVIPTLIRLRQKDSKFEPKVDCIARPTTLPIIIMKRSVDKEKPRMYSKYFTLCGNRKLGLERLPSDLAQN